MNKSYSPSTINIPYSATKVQGKGLIHVLKLYMNKPHQNYKWISLIHLLKLWMNKPYTPFECTTEKALFTY